LAVEKHAKIICAAWKWAGERKVHVRALPDYPSYKDNPECDKALVKDIWAVLDRADIVVWHNGSQFDRKRCNARIIAAGLPMPSPYKQIDTCKVSRKNLDFGSNKLDDLGDVLNLGRKVQHQGRALWFACLAGDEKAWRKMRVYNARDVVLLERLYKKLRPWCDTHPDLRVITGKENACPVWQSRHIQKRGFSYAKTVRRQRLHCEDCGAWFAGDRVSF
jgi:DNA polymerase III epsilon subunit-like protein